MKQNFAPNAELGELLALLQETPLYSPDPK